MIQHLIQITNNEPVQSKPYDILLGVRQSLQNKIQDMLKMNVIRKSESPYTFPIRGSENRTVAPSMCGLQEPAQGYCL